VSESAGKTLDALDLSKRGQVPTIVLRGAARRYETGAGVVTALEGVDIEVSAGEFVVVLGPSGCGKTTLLNVIGALDVASEGEVFIAGRTLRDRTRKELFRLRRETVCFVFQSFNLFPSLTALENVQFGADVGHRGSRGVDGAAIAHRALTQVGLEARVSHFPHELSGGEQQRVAIARALVHEPRLMVCDEPTAALDAHNGYTAMELLRAVAMGRDRAVIVVTHDNRIFDFADRIVHMEDGRVTGVEPGAAACEEDRI
jgi:putative ABC transport system ATP-binding protein